MIKLAISLPATQPRIWYILHAQRTFVYHLVSPLSSINARIEDYKQIVSHSDKVIVAVVGAAEVIVIADCWPGLSDRSLILQYKPNNI